MTLNIFKGITNETKERIVNYTTVATGSLLIYCGLSFLNPEGVLETLGALVVAIPGWIILGIVLYGALDELLDWLR